MPRVQDSKSFDESPSRWRQSIRITNQNDHEDCFTVYCFFQDWRPVARMWRGGVMLKSERSTHLDQTRTHRQTSGMSCDRICNEVAAAGLPSNQFTARTVYMAEWIASQWSGHTMGIYASWFVSRSYSSNLSIYYQIQIIILKLDLLPSSDQLASTINNSTSGNFLISTDSTAIQIDQKKSSIFEFIAPPSVQRSTDQRFCLSANLANMSTICIVDTYQANKSEERRVITWLISTG